MLTFGPFRLFPAERRLEKEGRPVRLGGRALDLLIVLGERPGEVVSNRVLLESVWPDVTVEESSLRFHIKNLRKVLSDNQSGARYVANVPGRGYCLAVPVERIDRMDAAKTGGAPGAARTNLPARGTTVIGRSDSMEAVSRDLSRRRIVTIVGPGGIGKTTLAIATARALRASFGDAVVFVDLAPIEDPSLVVSILVSALGLVLRIDEPCGRGPRPPRDDLNTTP